MTLKIVKKLIEIDNNWLKPVVKIILFILLNFFSLDFENMWLKIEKNIFNK